MIVRILIALIAILAATPALAQQPPQQTAPERHAATGLAFPPQMGPGVRDGSHDYGKTHNRPDLGYSWHYTARGLFRASAYVYAYGLTSIASGPASPVVIAQLDQSVTESLDGAKRRNEDLRVVKAAHDCPFGRMVFRCATLSLVRAAGESRLDVWLMVTGYRDHFVKLRIDWLPGAQGAAAARNWVAAIANQMR